MQQQKKVIEEAVKAGRVKEEDEDEKFIKGLQKQLREGLLAMGGQSDRRGNVTVNVHGSVISEKDLVERVRKGLVDSQRNGAQLIYQNT